jgi:hypothetical protein
MAEMATDDMVYIVVKGCGCVVGIVVDDAEYLDDTARSVQEFIRDGLAVERVSRVEGVRRLKRCAHVMVAK